MSGVEGMLSMNEWRKESSEVHLPDTVFLGWRSRERAIPEIVSDLPRSPVAPKVPPEGGARLEGMCQWLQFTAPKTSACDKEV